MSTQELNMKILIFYIFFTLTIANLLTFEHFLGGTRIAEKHGTIILIMVFLTAFLLGKTFIRLYTKIINKIIKTKQDTPTIGMVCSFTISGIISTIMIYVNIVNSSLNLEERVESAQYLLNLNHQLTFLFLIILFINLLIVDYIYLGKKRAGSILKWIISILIVTLVYYFSIYILQKIVYVLSFIFAGFNPG